MVQRVEVDVRVSVEMVVVTFSISELPEVTVFVTGHVVRVVYTLIPCQLCPRGNLIRNTYTSVRTIS